MEVAKSSQKLCSVCKNFVSMRSIKCSECDCIVHRKCEQRECCILQQRRPSVPVSEVYSVEYCEIWRQASSSSVSIFQFSVIIVYSTLYHFMHHISLFLDNFFNAVFVVLIHRLFVQPTVDVCWSERTFHSGAIDVKCQIDWSHSGISRQYNPSQFLTLWTSNYFLPNSCWHEINF